MPDYHFYTAQKTNQAIPSLFFNSSEYLRIHASETLFSFYLQTEETRSTIARIHFTIEKKIAYNPVKAPFGGLETSIFDIESLSLFWEQIEKTLMNNGANRIEVRSWPDSYFPEQRDFNRYFYNSVGFSTLFSDVSFHHQVGKKSALELFRKPEKKRFRKCVRAGFKFEQWIQPNVDQAYLLLSDFRKAKNIPLNIQKEILIKSIEQFPDKYSIFTVMDNKKIIGLSVCVEVNKDILYHFCLATDIAYQSFSPSVLLYEGIYHYCIQKAYKLFDFGTASIRGEKQESLCAFKEHLGGIASLKPTFIKILE